MMKTTITVTQNISTLNSIETTRQHCTCKFLQVFLSKWRHCHMNTSGELATPQAYLATMSKYYR